MKRLMLAIAATAAFVSVASAEEAWFTGTIGSESAGNWTMAPGSGSISTNSTTLVLDEATSDSFAATTQKSLASSENLNFATSAKFAYSYDELPEIESGAKAGIVVYTNEYYVLAKDDTTNNWAATGIAAASLDSDVAVSVTISNDNSKVFAIYNIAGSVINKEVVAGDSAWGTVDYKGSGEVASLVGTTISLSPVWQLPGDGGSIAVDPEWAAANKINQEAFASTEKLSNGFTASESYILGLNTNEDLVATFAVSGDNLVVNVPAPKVADKVQFDIYVNDALVAENATLPYAVCACGDVGSDEKKIEVRPRVSGQSVATAGKSQTIGIWMTPQYAKNTSGYIVIPYECAVSTALFNLADAGHVDQMSVYDAESGEWDTWTVEGVGSAWTYVPTPGRTYPITTVLHPGQAVKVSIGEFEGDNKAFWVCGTVVDRTKTAVVAGKYNLIGNPEKSSVPLSMFDSNAKIRTFDATTAHVLPDISYVKYDSVWYKIPLNGRGTTATVITGANAFFLNTTVKEITWPPANNE